MYYIGLDLSVNYSSYTVTKDFKNFWFGSVINDTHISQKKRNYLDELTFKMDNFDISYTNRAKRGADNSYSENEREKLVNYIEVSSKLSNRLQQITGGSPDVIIGIEGMAYGAQGAAVFDIPFLTGIIRRDLLVNVLRSDAKKMFIFPPSELKNTIGCKGNAKKDKIFDAFVDDPMIESVKDDEFWKYLSMNTKDDYVRHVNGSDVTIGSPFNDIIDSYLSVLKFYNELNPKNE